MVQVACGFSDSEDPSRDRRHYLRRSLGRLSPSHSTRGHGGSALAPAVGANVSGGERVEVVPPTTRQREGKTPAVEMTVSDVTLTASHFVPADFATRPEITPFVDGVCQVVAPSDGLGLFTELNEFDESCAATESLFVRVRAFSFAYETLSFRFCRTITDLAPLIQGLAAYLSAKKSALDRLDGYRLRLRETEEDLRHKEDERRVVAYTLKKANAENKSLTGENKSLRAELEAANKRDAERDRQLAAAEEKIKSLETRLVLASSLGTWRGGVRQTSTLPWSPATLRRLEALRCAGRHSTSLSGCRRPGARSQWRYEAALAC